MKQLLMIPRSNELKASAELAKEYSLGFEFNDFFSPSVLDSEEEKQRILREYACAELPSFRTVHGAFLDVIPFSPDPKIREIAALRIEQSIQAAKSVGAAAVVFHTNYNPQLNSPEYIELWLRQNVDFWSGILKKNPDISIYLENMFDDSPEVLEKLSESLSQYPNYGVCLDFAHAALSSTSPEVWAKQLGRFVKHIHINDNDLKSDLHLAWGDAKIDRFSFYRCYERYLEGASILIEVSSVESTCRSLEVMERDGFI